MENIDDLILQHICSYFNTITCKCEDLDNLVSVSCYFKEKIPTLIRFQRHKVKVLVNCKSKIQWYSNKICLTCNRLSDSDCQELMHIKQQFTNIYNINRYSYSREMVSYEKRNSSSIFIHRNTQQELESFIIKLRKIAKNIVITRNYCCDGKGVEIDLEQASKCKTII